MYGVDELITPLLLLLIIDAQRLVELKQITPEDNGLDKYIGWYV